VSAKYRIQGQSKPIWITFDKKSFVASGGEGSVYVKGQTAYKLYNDPSKMMAAGKIQELSAITDPNIIRPQNIILGKNDRAVGYTMRYIPDAYALVQLFTKAFRQRQGLSHEMVQKLVQKLRALVSHVHGHKILIVDLNEMNFLVNKGFDEIFAIDTDSYQTPSYPATAIMDSIRDRHAKNFTELTDWFSFGVISFQMFIGIHPYKGKHPKVKDMDDRMMKNISIFNGDVRIPHVCYPLDVIQQTSRRLQFRSNR
jgi:serine/threonine protein kinase